MAVTLREDKGSARPRWSGGAATTSSGFDRLRAQFEQRRRSELQELTHAIAEVDTRLFYQDATIGVKADFTLHGAVPPTTASRAPDVMLAAATGRGEQQAARELALRARTADSEARARLAQSGRESRPRILRPSMGARCGGFSVTSSAPSSPSRGSHAASPKTAGGGLGKGSKFDWENGIYEFHRNAERIHDASLIAETFSREEAEQEEQRETVRQHTFERSHRQREAAITLAKRQRDRREAHRDYQLQVQTQLFAVEQQKLAEMERTRGGARERRARSEMRREAAAAYHDFVLWQTHIEKTCRSVDKDSIKATEQARTHMRVAQQKNSWAARARQLESRKLLCQEQLRVQSEEAEMQLRFRDRKQHTFEAQVVEEKRQRIRATRAFDALLKTAREGISADTGAHVASLDMEAYERTLIAFRDLAASVRKHGLSIQAAAAEQDQEDGDDGPHSARASPPLVPLEMRVRSVLGVADAPVHAESEALHRPETLEEFFSRFVLEGEEDGEVDSEANLVEQVMGGSDYSSDPALWLGFAVGATDAAPRVPRLSLASPTSPVHPERPASLLPLTARPLVGLLPQALTARRDRVKPDDAGLAALRRVRRTGPMTARGPF